ncbi:DNA-directed RNA polymerase III subunit RPC5 [Phlebotomus argentipes]|uniref:DNA-directed RNA polymerase III subunit RPC5 n=1 Tax=Phlebotomus argentipes TaxID=94469 RepID=UPI0028931A4B|nr:DNA-directed RNA polymerase III subunit RPC5 [Phlebotomus argentipes]
MEEEDPVVEEIPVYLSKSLAENLYVFQFSTREGHYTIDCNDVVNCCVKPHNQQVKVDFGLDTNSRNYDNFKGSQLAIGADGKHPSKGDRPSYPDGTMDKMSFMSSKALQNSGNYVIGVMQDREVHTTPLNGILQMRPSFSYFDKQDARRRAEQKTESELEAEEEELKQITVKFARSSDSEKAKKAREKTFDFLAAREAEEPWCEAFWHPNQSAAVELEKQRLFCTKTTPTGHTLASTSRDYVKALIPPERHDKSVESIVPSGIVSLYKLKDLGLQEQIKNILIDVKMVSLTQLLAILDDREASEEKVVRILPLVGMLIRGNWVVQSEILYPVESFSSTNGISSEIMCRSRDYVLHQLVKRNCVDRQKIAAVIQLPPEEVKEILLSVAQVSSRGWELPLMPDVRFEAKYPEMVSRQELWWRSREDLFAEMESEKGPKRVRKRSIRESSKVPADKVNGTA